ncbi:PP-loop domain protein [Thermocrinis albus DSM 14484]|uniref:PP-loop domain protein n=1 Tax=Thermocrinis albus (strain DSM 14484 / JCM 11386 / HI 11/12) TaxID=638303 RepID=D3SND3_THEAH|nr:TIGR00269 family protein [Thermocrinis albus]ADC88670.1 PP-loop domain protein [Thermocrinis albus DSM 14484]
MRRCVKCKEKASIYLPHHRLSLCSQHYVEWFEERVQRTIKQFGMMEKRDRVLVAVSGGKDSLSLWQVLHRLGYEADGLYIDLGIGDYSAKSKELCKKFSERIGRKLHIVDLSQELSTIPQIKQLDSRPACSFCGSIKRYYMNLYAKKLGYTVVATGHNLDDETAVLLSNVLSWNLQYLERQTPLLEEKDGFVRKVKPLCLLTERETALYAVVTNIDYIEEECPFAENATSIDYKKIMAQIEEKSPGTKLRFYLEFLRKVRPALSSGTQPVTLKPCSVCGEPTVGEICSLCRIRRKLSVKTQNITELPDPSP